MTTVGIENFVNSQGNKDNSEKQTTKSEHEMEKRKTGDSATSIPHCQVRLATKQLRRTTAQKSVCSSHRAVELNVQQNQKLSTNKLRCPCVISQLETEFIEYRFAHTIYHQENTDLHIQFTIKENSSDDNRQVSSVYMS